LPIVVAHQQAEEHGAATTDDLDELANPVPALQPSCSKELHGTPDAAA
jgi:hypothetical protein